MYFRCTCSTGYDYLYTGYHPSFFTQYAHNIVEVFDQRPLSKYLNFPKDDRRPNLYYIKPQVVVSEILKRT